MSLNLSECSIYLTLNKILKFLTKFGWAQNYSEYSVLLTTKQNIEGAGVNPQTPPFSLMHDLPLHVINCEQRGSNKY